MAALTLATIGAIASIAGTTASTGIGIGQAVRQKRLQKEAEAAAAKSMAEARKRLDVNVYEALGIPKEVYELEREALLQQGQLALQAGMEGSQRGAAATAGRVQLAQQRGQAGVRSQMAKELYGLEKMTAAEEARLRDMGYQLDLAEAEGAQIAAARAEQARQQALSSAAGAVTQLGFQAMQLAPLYDKSAGVKAAERAFKTAEKGGVSMAEVKANLAKQGVVNGVDYSKVAGMTDAQFETFLQETANPAFINSFMESNYGTPFAPFSLQKRQGIQSEAARAAATAKVMQEASPKIQPLPQTQPMVGLEPLPIREQFYRTDMPYVLPTDIYPTAQQSIPTQGYVNQFDPFRF